MISLIPKKNEDSCESIGVVKLTKLGISGSRVFKDPLHVTALRFSNNILEIDILDFIKSLIFWLYPSRKAKLHLISLLEKSWSNPQFFSPFFSTYPSVPHFFGTSLQFLVVPLSHTKIMDIESDPPLCFNWMGHRLKFTLA